MASALRTLGVIAAASVATACARSTPMQPVGFTAADETRTASSNGGANAPRDESISDVAIVRAVLDSYRGEPGLEGSDVVVTSVDGNVRLSGNARNALAKDRAVALAERVRGVRSLLASDLTVPRGERSDDEIASDVHEALDLDPVGARGAIEASSRDGVVTLKGSIDDARDLSLAEEIAKGVVGVREVHDELVPRNTRTDAELRKVIRDRIASDPNVDMGLIDVRVQAGNATVSGSATSLAERSEIDRIARGAGARHVDTHALAIEWWRRPVTKKPKLGDDDVRQLVSNALAADARVPLEGIDVTVDHGRVSLSGLVDSLAEKHAAEQDAARTPGVHSVNDAIVLRAGPPNADRIVELRTRRALDRDPYVYPTQIGVTVKNGVVTLRGLVPDEFAKSRADALAEHVSGVSGVVDALQVEGNPSSP